MTPDTKLLFWRTQHALIVAALARTTVDDLSIGKMVLVSGLMTAGWQLRTLGDWHTPRSAISS